MNSSRATLIISNFIKNVRISPSCYDSKFYCSFLNLIDTVMVGRLEAEIAAVGVANQYFFFIMFLIGFVCRLQRFISQYWGKNDLANIKRILGIGLISVFIISLVFIIVGFLNPMKVMSLFNKDEIVIRLGADYLKIVLFS